MLAVYYLDAKSSHKNKTLSSIVSLTKENGQVGDLINTIGVQSIEDIYYSQDAKSLNVWFGKFAFVLEKKDIDSAYVEDLKTIGVSLFVKEDGGLQLKYKGKDIKEVVK